MSFRFNRKLILASGLSPFGFNRAVLPRENQAGQVRYALRRETSTNEALLAFLNRQCQGEVEGVGVFAGAVFLTLRAYCDAAATRQSGELDRPHAQD